MEESSTRAPVTLTRGLFTAVIKSAASNNIRSLEAEIRRKVMGDRERARELEDKVIKQANRIIDLENENLGLKEEMGMMMKEVQSHKEKISKNAGPERCSESQMRIFKDENENLKRDMEDLRQKCESETIEKDDKINQLQIRLKDIELNKSRGSIIERDKHLTRIQELVDENKELSKSLIEKKTIYYSMSDEISALRETVQELEASKHSVGNIMHELANEKEKNKQMEKDISYQMKVVEKEVKRKLKFKRQLEEEVLNSQKAENETKRLQHVLQSKSSELDEVQKASEELNKKHDNLNKRLGCGTCSILQTTILIKEKDVNSLKESNKKLQDDLQNSEAMFHETLGEQQKEFQNIKEQLTSSKDQIQSLQQCQNMRQAQVQTLRSENVELESKVKDLTDDVENKEKMLLDADEEAEAFKLREAESVTLISVLEEKLQKLSESKEEQSKGFQKVSDELKVTMEENVVLAERLRIVKTDKKEEIESLMNMNEELKEVNENLENKIFELNTQLDGMANKPLAYQEEEENIEEEESLSIGWDGLTPESDNPATDHSSFDNLIDNLQKEISTSELSSSVLAEEEEVTEDNRPADSSTPQSYSPQMEDGPNPDDIINKYAGKILLDEMEDMRQWMKQKADGSVTDFRQTKGSEEEERTNSIQKETFTATDAEEQFKEKKQRKELKLDNIERDSPAEKSEERNNETVWHQSKDISKEDEIRSLVRPARDLVPHVSNKQWASIEKKVIEKYIKSNINIKASHFTALIKPFILKYAEKCKSK